MTFRSFGGPTVAFTFGGVSFLTDPTFDEPGGYRSRSPCSSAARPAPRSSATRT
jgi:hypothetical protein